MTLRHAGVFEPVRKRVKVRFPGQHHLLSRFLDAREGYGLGAAFVQDAHSGTLEQRVYDPRLPPGLLVHILKGVGAYGLPRLAGSLGEKIFDIGFCEIGYRRGIFLNVERRAGVWRDAAFRGGYAVLKIPHADERYRDGELPHPALGEAVPKLPKEADQGLALQDVHLVEKHDEWLGGDRAGPASQRGAEPGLGRFVAELGLRQAVAFRPLRDRLAHAGDGPLRVWYPLAALHADVVRDGLRA